HLSMSTKFFISFVACDVNVIGDLFYITLHLYNRQYVFKKTLYFIEYIYVIKLSIYAFLL
ncbi:TPA: hypothetical protein ACVG9G_005913, partial [Bacillus thuringiensis]